MTPNTPDVETAKAAKKAANLAEGQAAALAKIAAMPDPYRAMAERIHALILEAAPELRPTTWYGMPAYYKGKDLICYFRSDPGFMTFGLSEKANTALEPGAPHQLRGASWYFDGLDAATEAALAGIVRKAAS